MQGALDLIPGWGTKIPQAAQCWGKKKTICFCSSRRVLCNQIRAQPWCSHSLVVWPLVSASKFGGHFIWKNGDSSTYLIEKFWDPHDIQGHKMSWHPSCPRVYQYPLAKTEEHGQGRGTMRVSMWNLQCICLQLAIFTITYNLTSVTEILIGTCKESHGFEESA